MSDEVGSGAVPSPVATVPVASCCERRDAATAGACVLCSQPICRNCQRVINGKRACLACLRKILAEIEGQKPTAANLLAAVAGGVVAAALCGAAWTAMVVATKMEIGYAAVGVGLATGYGVFWGAGKRRGAQLQMVAVGCALLGLILGKYFTLAYLILHSGKVAGDVSYFDPRLVRAFFELLPKTLSFFDALWAFIALRIAWRVAKPADLRVTRALGAA
jgi:hypothetical protein